MFSSKFSKSIVGILAVSMLAVGSPVFAAKYEKPKSLEEAKIVKKKIKEMISTRSGLVGENKYFEQALLSGNTAQSTSEIGTLANKRDYLQVDEYLGSNSEKSWGGLSGSGAGWVGLNATSGVIEGNIVAHATSASQVKSAKAHGTIELYGAVGGSLGLFKTVTLGDNDYNTISKNGTLTDANWFEESFSGAVAYYVLNKKASFKNSSGYSTSFEIPLNEI